MAVWDLLRRAAAPMPPLAELAESTAPDFAEIASTRDGRDITRGYVHPEMLLPSSDALLQAKGGDLLIYQEVLRDDQVQTSFGQRRSAVTSAEWDVEAGGARRTPLDWNSMGPPSAKVAAQAITPAITLSPCRG